LRSQLAALEATEALARPARPPYEDREAPARADRLAPMPAAQTRVGRSAAPDELAQEDFLSGSAR
jgi:hypothetical protein